MSIRQAPSGRKEGMKLSKHTRRKALNALFILATFGMVVYFAVKSGDLSNIGASLANISSWWLLGGVGCFLIHMSMEGGLLYVFFRFQRVNVRLRHCISIGLIGMYYSSITPAATGGQPMQVYSMKKHGVPAGITSSALAVKFFCWQCALLLVGAVLWILHVPLIAQSLGPAIWMVWLGFFLNGAAIVLVILLAISRNAVRAIIIFFVSLAHKLRLVKDKERSSSRWDAALQDFHASVDLLTGHPLRFLVLFLLSVVQVTGLMSATYFVYRGFGNTAHTYFEVLAVQYMLFIAASFTPLPGASGAQEGGFYLFFKDFFAPNTIFAALFVWRFLTYYLSIITGFIAVAIDGAQSGKKKAAELPLPDEPEGGSP